MKKATTLVQSKAVTQYTFNNEDGRDPIDGASAVWVAELETYRYTWNGYSGCAPAERKFQCTVVFYRVYQRYEGDTFVRLGEVRFRTGYKPSETEIKKRLNICISKRRGR